ncbi:MAG: DUF882 domain-containing protein [Geminicoccaceae bacterium]|nr:MAG: DUF882 domain-containing protein [Geminicoccaceae bacterium]
MHPPMRSLSRRSMLAGLTAALALTVAPQAGWAKAGERRLKFRHLHTDERLDVTYFAGGRYRPAELLKVDHLFRDWRAQEAIRIDHRLLDMLFEIQQRRQTFAEVEVLSGYRTVETNRWLRQRSRGVALRSLHTVGKAVDMRMAGVPLGDVRRTAVSLEAGGVGFYPRSNFVHIDTGAVRSWG